MDGGEDTRVNEWFVPRFGPKRFRLAAGLSFYPYTVMNASYVVIGSLLATPLRYDRVAGMALAYILAVGVSAHSLDALAPNKPWGDFLSRRQLQMLAVGGLVPALGLGFFYALTGAPLLFPLGAAELFFLLAYNLELFGGVFHTDYWFAASWGFLPVLAGYVAQANSVSLSSLAGASFGFFTAFVEISASRPYRALKRVRGGPQAALAARLESVLKGIVLSVLAVALLLFLRAVYG